MLKVHDIIQKQRATQTNLRLPTLLRACRYFQLVQLTPSVANFLLTLAVGLETHVKVLHQYLILTYDYRTYIRKA